MEPRPSVQQAPTGVLPLRDWGLIVARGPEAGSFLQGQLTQDIVSMGQDEARLAGYCSAKGRLLATFVVVRAGAQEWWLACSADLLAPTLKRLSMFVLRARCTLSDGGNERSLWGLVGPEALRDHAGAGTVPGAVVRVQGRTLVRLADAQGLPRALLVQELQAPAPEGQALSPEDWSWHEVRSAVVRVQSRTVELFVPQMVNLELVGGVSFRKGCYPGQEVVARSQYRGTLKRRAYRYAASLEAGVVQPGDEIVAQDDPGQPAGTVVLAARVPGHPGQWELLAETKIAAAQAASLHLGAPDGPLLQPLALPYPLPTEA